MSKKSMRRRDCLTVILFYGWLTVVTQSQTNSFNMWKGESMSVFTIDPVKCNRDGICTQFQGLAGWAPKVGKAPGDRVFCAICQKQPALALDGGWRPDRGAPPGRNGDWLDAFGAVMVGYAKLKYQRLPLRNEPRVNWKWWFHVIVQALCTALWSSSAGWRSECADK